MPDAKKPEADAVEAPPKKSRGKWLLFGLVGVVCLVLGGAAAFFLLPKPAPAESENGSEAAKHEVPRKKTDHTPPVFYKFDKAFTVKLQTELQEAYLQAEVQMKLSDQQEQELLKQYEPELKHRITLALMSKKASELNSATGVQRLANELRDVANLVIVGPPETPKTGADAAPAEAANPDDPVQSVLFSSFIIQ
ncbi:MAG: flagellar basal body-associated FliL family protein [Sulfuritalea sp.]|nr:flagellar basal body-associated FliL family protein [Sulfuritalea sp.]